MSIRKLVLWLFVINLGIACGAGLYESRVEFPLWLVHLGSAYIWNAEAARNANSGLRFWVFVSTIPLTLFTVVNLGLALKSRGPIRAWWLGAVGACIIERALTFGYFIPTMIGLMSAESNSAIIAKAIFWGNLNYLRHLLGFGAWIAALKAFAIAHAEPNSR